MDVREIRCPGCFAPVDMSRGPIASCRFCGTTLAVQGAGGVAVAPVGPPGTLFLEDGGSNKIAVIKVIREHTGLGLKESKDLVEAAPCVVAQWQEPARMAAFRRDLVEAGARVR